MQLLDNLYGKIDFEADSMIEMIKQGILAETEVFDQPIRTIPLKDRPSCLRGRKGVYVFVLQEKIQLTHEEVMKWSSIAQAGFQIWKAHTFLPGECLYLGSVWGETGSIYCRLGEHYSDSKDAKGLALGHPNRLKLKDKVTVYAFPIKKSYSRESYRILLPAIESRLHDKLHDVVGMKR